MNLKKKKKKVWVGGFTNVEIILRPCTSEQDSVLGVDTNQL